MLKGLGGTKPVQVITGLAQPHKSRSYLVPIAQLIMLFWNRFMLFCDS